MYLTVEIQNTRRHIVMVEMKEEKNKFSIRVGISTFFPQNFTEKVD